MEVGPSSVQDSDHQQVCIVLLAPFAEQCSKHRMEDLHAEHVYMSHEDSRGPRHRQLERRYQT